MNLSLLSEKLFGSEPHKRVLDNGLTVLCAPDFSAGLLSVQVWVKTGSIHEGDLLGSGLSHYLEHMVFKGTEKYSCRELTQVVQKTGGSMNAYTTFDRTVYHIDLPAEGLEVAVDVLAEMMLRAKLTSEDTARERDVILREIDMRDDDPDSILAETVLAETFRTHPYRLPVIGLRSAFAKVTHEQLCRYYRERYVPNNMVLVVAGAASPDAVYGMAEKFFGVVPAAALGAPNIPVELPQLAMRRGSLQADVQVLRGCMAWRIPGMRHADAPALDVFSILLGMGQSGRLHRRLHEELGLVHQIDGSNWAPGSTGLFWLWYTATPGKRNEIEKTVCETIADILRDGFTEKEFSKAQRACIIAFLESRKTVSGMAGQLGAYSVVVGDMGYPKLYLERIQALTSSAVIEVARRHIREDQLTCYAMEPRSDIVTGKDAEEVVSTKSVPFEEVTLENGLRILLQPVSGYPKINYRMLFTGGGVCEPIGKRGACALLATMLARDTEKRTAAEVAETAETAGASLQETAGNNTFGLAIEVLSGDQSLAHELLADAVLHPAFNEKTFIRERDAQHSGLLEDEDDVVEFGKRRLRRLFFGDHPFAVDYMGLEDDLLSISVADIKALYPALIIPSNCVISVSGDFDRDEILTDISRRFSIWTNATNSVPVVPFGRPAQTGRIDETQPREQAVVFLTFPDAGIADDDFIAGQLADELLSGMASQLFVSVREEKGMAYFVGANRLSAPHGGMFFLYAGTSPDNIEAVLAAMQDEVKRFRAGKFTEEEISSGKIRLSTAARMSRQTAGSRSLNAGLNALYGLPVNRDILWEEKLNALDAKALADFSNKYLQSENSLIYVVKPQEAGN
ncbi:MAG: insulinase family protein [Puniceicoccales bacterium]|jgi:zinc protease|nr:insulinase family protein [Puniceicoccales bacterium]